MKVLLGLLVGITLCATSYGQDWFPVGATWHYSRFNPPVFLESYELTVEKDTIVKGQPCQSLQGQIVYQESGRVYVYNSTVDTFTVLYDFNSIVGDSWVAIYDDGVYSDTLTVYVDSLGTEVVGSDTLKSIYIHSLNAYWNIYGWSIERIGSSNFLFPQYGLADPQIGPLRCYTDTVISTYQHWGPWPCDTSYVVSSMPDIYISDQLLEVYPNPFTTTTTIQSTQSISSYSIYNISGRQVREEGNLFSKTVTIDRGDLPSGMYFIEVMSKEGVLAREKVVIQ